MKASCWGRWKTWGKILCSLMIFRGRALALDYLAVGFVEREGKGGMGGRAMTGRGREENLVAIFCSSLGNMSLTDAKPNREILKPK